jgi:hypothetical protein
VTANIGARTHEAITGKSATWRFKMGRKVNKKLDSND